MGPATKFSATGDCLQRQELQRRQLPANNMIPATRRQSTFLEEDTIQQQLREQTEYITDVQLQEHMSPVLSVAAPPYVNLATPPAAGQDCTLPLGSEAIVLYKTPALCAHHPDCCGDPSMGKGALAK
ncbi:hypothetical protein NDU88_000073 [Pleurodeles waltl]|uniref:Uncharacterized protein n=1 Tax=Pleurodeles waltl TaxID=8319 RepID=A0AAV7KNY5_PLEWA|nr:hypothetical protein NDU88_000073 [Pleurodeles waltl]